MPVALLDKRDVGESATRGVEAPMNWSGLSRYPEGSPISLSCGSANDVEVSLSDRWRPADSAGGSMMLAGPSLSRGSFVDCDARGELGRSRSADSGQV